jgi:hypothetical protein
MLHCRTSPGPGNPESVVILLRRIDPDRVLVLAWAVNEAKLPAVEALQHQRG